MTADRPGIRRSRRAADPGLTVEGRAAGSGAHVARCQGGLSYAAFSLAETTIVLACACLLGALAAPALRTIHAEWSLWGGTYQVESALQWGRLQAITKNASLIFEVGQGGHSIWWKDAATGETYETTVRWLPRGVRIGACPAQPVRFFPRGNAAPAGSYVVAGDAGEYRVVVSPAGRIRVERL
ncbi:MAG: GspH/FimT family pseudopilin [Acidobacteria bacterium]|nr:GspH/FimT family pseudopilin [Acidobacteriota bacterium]